MGQHTLPGNPPVTISLRRSSRARRISLRVSGLDGQVTLTLPQGVPEREGLNFAMSKGSWLRAQLDQKPDQIFVRHGMELPFEGQVLRIGVADNRRSYQADGNIMVPGPPETVAIRVRAYLKARARDRLVAASDHYADRLGRRYDRITLRDTRSRWGSCSADGRLMFSWRLIMAPSVVLNYVAAHEAAHLQEMNHSSAFWNLVADLMPDYRVPRKWLRDNGAALHRYRFGD